MGESMISKYKLGVGIWELPLANKFIKSGIELLYDEDFDDFFSNCFMAYYHFSVGIERLQKVSIILDMDIEENCKVLDKIVSECKDVNKLTDFIKINKSELSKVCVLNYKNYNDRNNETIDVCIKKILNTLKTLPKIHNLLKLHEKTKEIELSEEELKMLKELTFFYEKMRYENFNYVNEDSSDLFSELIFDENNNMKNMIKKNIISIANKYYSKIKLNKWMKTINDKDFIFINK